MRTTLIALMVVVLAVFVVPACGQGNKGSLEKLMQSKQAAREQEITKELAQSEYKAKMDIPASDGLFVNEGKLVEALYNVAMRENKVAIHAGALAKVTKVKILDYAIQVFFDGDTVAVIGSQGERTETADMTNADLLALARKSIGPLFEAVKKVELAKQ